MNDCLKTAIYGDSYADPNSVFGKIGGWTVQLLCNLHEVDHEKSQDVTIKEREYFINGNKIHGISGGNLWFSFKSFLLDIEKYSNIENVVFVYTAPHRIPFITDKYLGFSFKTPPLLSDDDPKDLKDFINFWYSNIDDPMYSNFFFNSVFKSVNDICRKNKIKLVNIIPTIESLDECPDTDFPIITGILNLSSKECGGTEFLNVINDYWVTGHKHDIRYSHLNYQNNIVLFRIVKECLDDQTISYRDITKESDIDTSLESWQKINSYIGGHLNIRLDTSSN